MGIVLAILRAVFGLFSFAGALSFLILGVIFLRNRNLRYGVFSLFMSFLFSLGVYESVAYTSSFWFWFVFFATFLALAAMFFVLKEGELGFLDRFKSPERLISEGKLRKAALKLKRRGRVREAARLYEKSGWLLSAALCYEEAGDWREVARIYIEVSQDPDSREFYLRKAKEILEKRVEDLEEACRVAEMLAELDRWYSKDAAILYEQLGRFDRAREMWFEFSRYMSEKAGVEKLLLAASASSMERAGKPEDAVLLYREFLDHARKMAGEEGGLWFRRVAEAAYALYRLTGEEAFLSEGDRALEEYSRYLDGVLDDPYYKNRLIEEVKSWMVETPLPAIP